MERLLARFGQPRADVRIEAIKEPPPGILPGGGILVSVALRPQEPFLLRRAWLELVLKTTRFSRTTLDGYREHTSEQVWQTVELCGKLAAQPRLPLIWSAELHLPDDPSFESRPTRISWMAKARFQAEGHREFSASKGIRDITPGHSGPPIVDGTGFLPLYEFRAGPES